MGSCVDLLKQLRLIVLVSAFFLKNTFIVICRYNWLIQYQVIQGFAGVLKGSNLGDFIYLPIQKIGSFRRFHFISERAKAHCNSTTQDEVLADVKVGTIFCLAAHGVLSVAIGFCIVVKAGASILVVGSHTHHLETHGMLSYSLPQGRGSCCA